MADEKNPVERLSVELKVDRDFLVLVTRQKADGWSFVRIKRPLFWGNPVIHFERTRPTDLSTPDKR